MKHKASELAISITHSHREPLIHLRRSLPKNYSLFHTPQSRRKQKTLTLLSTACLSSSNAHMAISEQ